MNSDARSQNSAREGHRASVDLFRAVAILTIIGVHLVAYFIGPGPFDKVGIVAVNGFLVLSGFLLSGSYLKAILDPSSAFPSSKKYALRRFLRIYPAYALAVMTTAAPYFFVRNNHGVSVFDVVAHLTMTHGFFPEFAQSAFNVPLWTMSVDAQFYVLLPFVAFALRSVAARLQPNERRALVAGSIVFLIVASLGVRMWAYSATPALENFKVALVYARNAIGLGSSFAFGIAIAFARLEGRKPSRSISLSLVALAVSCVAVLVVDGAQLSRNYVAQVTYDFIGALGSAALLYGLCQGRFRLVHKVAAFPAITWLAKISYGLYLFHKPFSIVAVHFLGNRLPPQTPMYGSVIAIFTLSCSTLVAMFISRLIDALLTAIGGRTTSRAEASGVNAPNPFGDATA